MAGGRRSKEKVRWQYQEKGSLGRKVGVPDRKEGNKIIFQGVIFKKGNVSSFDKTTKPFGQKVLFGPGLPVRGRTGFCYKTTDESQFVAFLPRLHSCKVQFDRSNARVSANPVCHLCCRRSLMRVSDTPVRFLLSSSARRFRFTALSSRRRRPTSSSHRKPRQGPFCSLKRRRFSGRTVRLRNLSRTFLLATHTHKMSSPPKLSLIETASGTNAFRDK